MPTTEFLRRDSLLRDFFSFNKEEVHEVLLPFFAEFTSLIHSKNEGCVPPGAFLLQLGHQGVVANVPGYDFPSGDDFLREIKSHSADYDALILYSEASTSAGAATGRLLVSVQALSYTVQGLLDLTSAHLWPLLGEPLRAYIGEEKEENLCFLVGMEEIVTPIFE